MNESLTSVERYTQVSEDGGDGGGAGGGDGDGYGPGGGLGGFPQGGGDG